MANALARETSPYLLQHRDNPVDWLPWGEEALRRAREHDRPLLVSIGYSACHWCHVMERESFEDPETAALMNEHFVCVKVDREERPDVDAIYMEAVQAMTGHGGWPLNVFLTPEQVPFYGGTYFPPEPRHGHAELAPGARRRRRRLARARATRSASTAAQMAERLRGGALLRAAATSRSQRGALDARGRRACARSFDRAHGGCGGAPKFPAGLDHRVPAARAARREMSSSTLRSMASGGIYDQVGGGFARYGVDATLAGPALREDALRQRAAGARLPARLAGHGRRRSCGARARRRSTGRCARCARPRAASTARWTPTPRAWRAVLRVDARRVREVLGEDADAAIATSA